MSALSVAMLCFPSPGGSGQVATELGVELAARGHHVHFVVASRPFHLCRHRDAGLDIHVATDPPPLSFLAAEAGPLALAAHLAHVCREHRVDIIHAHYAVPHAAVAGMARDVLGAEAPPLVITLHGTDVTRVALDPVHGPLVRHAVARASTLTVPSQSLREAAVQNLRPAADMDIHVIPNFIDTQRLLPRTDVARPETRALFPGLRDDERVLFHVSTFRPIKRVRDVVEVFAGVHARVPARLVLVGDGPDRADAEARVRALGLAGRVSFAGRRESFDALLREADVFLLPSETESFGLAALEALACGVPVVATAVGGLPELVRHGETGFLAPVGDVPAMVAHVTALLEVPERWHAFSEAARTDVLARFRAGPAVERYERLYRALVRS